MKEKKFKKCRRCKDFKVQWSLNEITDDQLRKIVGTFTHLCTNCLVLLSFKIDKSLSIKTKKETFLEINNPCQACNETNTYLIFKRIVRSEEKEEYKVCITCFIALVTYSLPKEKFQNLLKNGHNVEEFLLHEDFYNKGGNILQPIYK